MGKKLFIVSNRLPVTVEQKDGVYTCRTSSGGLVSAVAAYMASGGKDAFDHNVWVGLADCTSKEWDLATTELTDEEVEYRPLFSSKKLYDLYYNGFSNSVLWPLFHYFPSFVDYNADYFDAYRRINKTFAEALIQEAKEEDVIWIHDYHLLPLAALLREALPSVTIGFFLHIPFPSYELFRLLPKKWQHELLEGLLGADLIGFHTMDYVSHFIYSAEMILKTECDEHNFIFWKNRKIKINAFPIGIDFDKFYNAYADAAIADMRKEYNNLKGTKKMIFSVDRLDYTKGIPNRLKAYETFLSAYPEYIGKVIFVLVIIPSRNTIRKYAERKKMIDEYIGNLNSRMGTILWQPVVYYYNHLSFEELTALYTASDVALITPLRDGMNLVAKEFVASRSEQNGVLILSEMTGAAKELTEALLINPNDKEEIASMIKIAMEMPEEEQAQRIKYMQNYIRRYDVHEWARDVFESLQYAKDTQYEFGVKFLDSHNQGALLEKYTTSTKRLIFLDYDGTLVSFSKIPSEANPTGEVLELLKNLGAIEENDVYIISGRDSKTLEKWLGHLPIGLIAEHGSKIRHKHATWKSGIRQDDRGWITDIEKLMERYVSKCPGSFVEIKEFSIAWHYRNSNSKAGAVRAKELHKDLLAFTEKWQLNILNGSKVIEVRTKGIDKGTAVERIVNGKDYDFIFAAGDDVTDEDMFKELMKHPDSITVKIGADASFAKYNLYTPYMVLSLLNKLATHSKPVEMTNLL